MLSLIATTDYCRGVFAHYVMKYLLDLVGGVHVSASCTWWTVLTTSLSLYLHGARCTLRVHAEVLDVG